MRTATLVASLLCAVPAAAIAKERPATESPLLNDVTSCRAITDNVERLACFDAAAAKLEDAAARRSIVVLDQEQVRVTRRALFGFPLPKIPFFSSDSDGVRDQREETRTQLDTTITAVRVAGFGLWRLTLAEGGVWETTETDSLVNFKAGQSIHIEAGKLGGYMADVAKSQGIRIRRVQ